MSDDEGILSVGAWQDPDAMSLGGSAKSDSEEEKMNDAAPSQPIQKRRRVTRACDECRRKKIKCDGKNPCTHCSVYSYGTSSVGLIWLLPCPRKLAPDAYLVCP